MDKLNGKLINNRYKIISEIGSGGMADVFKATDVVTGNIVAIKVLKEDLFQDVQFRQRFINESQAVSMLSHPNIVHVYDVGLNRDLYYIVMEHVDGITLKQYIERKGALGWRETLYLTGQLLKALQHSHENGVIHRDIKPQNILLLSDGTIKVTDFGIARVQSVEEASKSETAIGSVHYISPEQVRGEETDRRSDIYSVGVLMYEMLTGKVPFDAENPISVALMQLQNKPVSPRQLNPDIPDGLEEIILRAMSKKPENRYGSTTEMLEDIERFKLNPSIRFEYTYFPEEDQSGYRKAVQESHHDDAEKGHTSKLRRLLLWIGSGVALLGLMALLIIKVVFPWITGLFGPSNPDISVPGFVGMTLSEAQLDTRFVFEVTEYVYDESIPADQILKQSPIEGYSVKEGATIRLTISKGKDELLMPDLVGSDIRLAESDLKLRDIPYEIVREHSDSVTLNYIIRTEPAADEPLLSGETVKLYVSNGTEVLTTQVPAVIGLTQREAESRLLDCKLIPKIETKVSDQPAGTVLSQSPSAGADVEEGASITITVSDGSLYESVKQVVISLPDTPATFMVRAEMDGVQVYAQEHHNTDKTATILLRGSGTKRVLIYVDGALVNTLDITF